MYDRTAVSFETVQATSMRQPRRRRRPRALFAVVIAVLAVTTLTNVPPQEGSAAPLAKETFNPTFGPLGPITVIGDSVMLGSVIFSPTLSDHLAARGWGPIRVRAGGGYTTGSWNTGEARASYCSPIRNAASIISSSSRCRVR